MANNVDSVCHALESAGIEFTNGDALGVRSRKLLVPSGLGTIRGPRIYEAQAAARLRA